MCLVFGTSLASCHVVFACEVRRITSLQDIVRAWTFWKPPLEDEDPWAGNGRQRLDSTSALEDMPDLKLLA
jgi:hypothetical protein